MLFIHTVSSKNESREWLRFFEDTVYINNIIETENETYLETLKTADVHHVISGFRNDSHHFDSLLEICRVESCPFGVLQYFLQNLLPFITCIFSVMSYGRKK